MCDKNNDNQPLTNQANPQVARAACDSLDGRFFRVLLRHLPGMLYRCHYNDKRTFAFVSPACLAITGYRPKAFRGDAPIVYAELIDPADRPRVQDDIAAALARGEPFQLNYRIHARDGVEKWVWELGRGIRNAKGEFYLLEGFIADITPYKRTQQALAASEERYARTVTQLQHDALHDALTGLPNRALFLDRLSQAIRLTHRYAARSFAVLYIDLDRFKLINDSLGRALGDMLLQQVGQRLVRTVRASDTLARVGGDEFLLLLENIHGRGEALQKVKSLEQALEQPFHVARHELYISASIGIVLGAKFYTRSEDMLRDANNAMHAAKKDDRSHAVFFDQRMRQHAYRRLTLENDIRRAVRHQQVIAYFQPIVCLKSGRILGFEALARWRHPKHGILLPAELIPIAEDTGLILPLGEAILAQSCAQLARWRRQQRHTRELTMSVNLSARQLSQVDLTERIARLLSKHELPGAALKLEITESALIDNLDPTTMLDDIRALGIRLIMDDFGTGYSSLSYLHSFPFDALKVDRSFVSQLPDDPNSVEIVDAIGSLAESLHLDAIPEGVETHAQFKALAEMGFESAQGFYFSKPMPAEQAETMLSTKHRWQRLATG